MVTIDDIRRFLKNFQEKMQFWDVVFLDDRGKNSQTLADLELKPKDRKTVLESLVAEDYYQGPLDELWYGSSEMWVFGKRIKGEEVFIKITLGKVGTSVICISFHFAEFPMSYPFKIK